MVLQLSTGRFKDYFVNPELRISTFAIAVSRKPVRIVSPGSVKLYEVEMHCDDDARLTIIEDNDEYIHRISPTFTAPVEKPILRWLNSYPLLYHKWQIQAFSSGENNKLALISILWKPQ